MSAIILSNAERSPAERSPAERSLSDVSAPMTSINGLEDRRVWINIAKVVGVLCVVALALIVIVTRLT